MTLIDPNSIALAICSFGFTGLFTYAVWCKARVVFIREELFAVRDQLWDDARRLNGFDDPAYLQARDHLNAGIKVVPSFSIRVLNYMQSNCTFDPIPRFTSSNPELQAAIDLAYESSGRWFAKYILFWRASGWMFVLKHSVRALQEATTAWLRSQGPAHLAQFESSLKLTA